MMRSGLSLFVDLLILLFFILLDGYRYGVAGVIPMACVWTDPIGNDFCACVCVCVCVNIDQIESMRKNRCTPTHIQVDVVKEQRGGGSFFLDGGACGGVCAAVVDKFQHTFLAIPTTTFIAIPCLTGLTQTRRHAVTDVHGVFTIIGTFVFLFFFFVLVVLLRRQDRVRWRDVFVDEFAFLLPRRWRPSGHTVYISLGLWIRRR